MVGDPYSLGQILLNLIGKAIKYTEEGGVTLKLERHGENLKLSVSDNCIGISEDKLDDIINSFRQEES